MNTFLSRGVMACSASIWHHEYPEPCSVPDQRSASYTEHRSDWQVQKEAPRMTPADKPPPVDVGRRKRFDARRNQQTLLDAAAAVFVRAVVDAPVREIAAEAGVGMGTIYRHFPTRADLVVAVFRHQLDALAVATTTTPAAGETPYEALRSW